MEVYRDLFYSMSDPSETQPGNMTLLLITQGQTLVESDKTDETIVNSFSPEHTKTYMITYEYLLAKMTKVIHTN